MVGPDLIILIAIAFVALIVSFFVIKKVIHLLYYLVIIVISLVPAYYLKPHFSTFLAKYLEQGYLLDIAGYALSFIVVYVILIAFIRYFTKSHK